MVRDENPSEDSTLADSLLDEPQSEPEAAAEPGTSRVKGFGRIFRGNRALWVTTLVAVVALIAGLLAGRFILSPADAAANTDAPKPGYITVPVEYGELSNDVTLRGQIGYADATEVTLSASELADAAVVTGHVPKVGDDLEEGSIALEIAGRPVFVLPGQLPSYRTLRHGMSGPDVAQLKQALNELGIDVGKGDKFNKDLAEGLRTLYTDAGYTPAIDQTAQDGVRSARDAVSSAEQNLRQSREDLKKAGPTKSQLQMLDNAVADAQRAVGVAKAELKQAKADGLPAPQIKQLEAAVKSAEGQVKVTKAQRTEGRKVDTTAAKAAVKAAEQQVKDAKADLTRARNAALPYLPAAEALFLVDLPRRVDQVMIQRGSVISGPVISVSGATIELSGSAADADARLLTVGDEAFFELPDGTEHRAVIAKIESGDGGGRATIYFTPDPLETEVIQQIQGMNVRVQVPVGATDGEVLSVPFAALTAGPGGESRVEVVEGDPRDERSTTRLVVVTTGLAAGGYVEVTPTDGELKAGDLVVVGA